MWLWQKKRVTFSIHQLDKTLRRGLFSADLEFSSQRIKATESSCALYRLLPNTTYYFRIAAVNRWIPLSHSWFLIQYQWLWSLPLSDNHNRDLYSNSWNRYNSFPWQARTGWICISDGKNPAPGEKSWDGHLRRGGYWLWKVPPDSILMCLQVFTLPIVVSTFSQGPSNLPKCFLAWSSHCWLR